MIIRSMTVLGALTLALALPAQELDLALSDSDLRSLSRAARHVHNLAVEAWVEDEDFEQAVRLMASGAEEAEDCAALQVLTGEMALAVAAQAEDTGLLDDMTDLARRVLRRVGRMDSATADQRTRAEESLARIETIQAEVRERLRERYFGEAAITITAPPRAAIVRIPSESAYDTAVRGARGPVLVHFHSPGCVPCRLMEPELRALASERPDLTILSVDIDALPDLARRLGVGPPPALFVYRGGQVVSRAAGYHSREQLSSLVDRQE